MFKLMDESEERLIKKWPVVVSVPQDEGRVAKHEIRADYLVLPQDELDDLMEASRDGDGKVDAGILRRVVHGLYDITDAAGNTIEYTPALLERMIQIPSARIALVSTYFEVAAGQKARRKN